MKKYFALIALLVTAQFLAAQKLPCSRPEFRQFGEMSNDSGKTWVTEYDLEYRRKK